MLYNFSFSIDQRQIYRIATFEIQPQDCHTMSCCIAGFTNKIIAIISEHTIAHLVLLGRVEQDKGCLFSHSIWIWNNQHVRKCVQMSVQDPLKSVIAQLCQKRPLWLFSVRRHNLTVVILRQLTLIHAIHFVEITFTQCDLCSFSYFNK